MNKIFPVKLAVMLCAPGILLGGCAVSASSGIVKGYPSDESPVVRCYMRAHEYLFPFFAYSRERLPKRAIFNVSLNDARTSQPVLRYKRQLPAEPIDLDFSGKLRGNLFVVDIHDPVTRQNWTLEFQRGADGQFRAVRETGVFGK